MNLLDLIAAYAIAQGSHTGGHFYQASNPDDPMRDVPMRLNAKDMIEEWGAEGDNPFPDRWQPPKEGDKYNALRISHKDYIDDRNKKAADIHGAGFEMQDRMSSMIDDPKTKSNVAGMNALIKGIYLSGMADKMAKGMIPGGDIGGMENTSGNRHVRELIAASMLADFAKYKNPESKWDVGFSTFNAGAPGLKLNYKW